MKKRQYYDWAMKQLEVIKASGEKPRLLLHVCCAPCSIYVLSLLSEAFDITLYFNNNNIYPYTEYLKRKNELISLVKRLREEENKVIEVIETEFKGEEYHQKLEPLKEEREGGTRCFLCYHLRMEEAYLYAVKQGYDYITTVMTISRQKNSMKINEIAEELENKYPSVPYFYSDFKKDNGILKRNQLVKQYNLYEQQYCGCQYSYQEYLKKSTE
jgi:Uncharacterized protein conserved in bacteria